MFTPCFVSLSLSYLYLARWLLMCCYSRLEDQVRRAQLSGRRRRRRRVRPPAGPHQQVPRGLLHPQEPHLVSRLTALRFMYVLVCTMIDR